MSLKNNKGIIGLIPARAGSKRVPNKNIRQLNGHPLLAYTISSAIQSGIFTRIIVSTESQEIAEIAIKYGAEVPFLRPQELAKDDSADIGWVVHLLNKLKKNQNIPECFSILRPTSPFRMPETISRAWKQFQLSEISDSLRAVEQCTQHPAKMWTLDNMEMEPVMVNPDQYATPWHSSPYQSLPKIYVQNASLEIAKCSIPLLKNTISGSKIMPFITHGYEGFDINFPEDWMLAELLVKNKFCKLPSIAL